MEIPLTQGRVAFVDDADADLATLKWYAQKAPKTFYALRNVPRSDGKRTTQRLHQVISRRMGIVGPPDHIDRNGLNNRRDNLRPATRTQNEANKARQTNNSSGFKGVSFNKKLGKYEAYITVNRKRKHLGLFPTPVEAAKAYDRAAPTAFGEFAVLNFPAAQRSL